MPIESLDLEGFLKFLKKKQGEQSDRQFARSLGVSPSYLSDVYKRRTMPGESITGPMFARRQTVFQVEVPDEEAPAAPEKEESR